MRRPLLAIILCIIGVQLVVGLHAQGRDFYPTPPPIAPVRQPAEFEPTTGVLIVWCNRLYIPYSAAAAISQVTTLYTIVLFEEHIEGAIAAYRANGVNLANCEFIVAELDSYWTRDYAPWFIFDGNNEMGGVNFDYDRPRPLDNDFPILYTQLDSMSLFGMDLQHNGGNYICDGQGRAISTEHVLDVNNMSADVLAGTAQQYLGIDRYDFFPDPLDSWNHHINCCCMFLGVDKIIIGEVPIDDPRHASFEQIATYYENATSSWGTPYRIYRVPVHSLTYPFTPYANSVIVNDLVLVPITGSPSDEIALATFQEAMPGYEVIGTFDSQWIGSDALNCRTHNIPDKEMLYIHHMPLYRVNVDEDLPIEVYIYPYSGADLIADSLQVRYRHCYETDWDAITLADAGDHTYTATLPPIACGDTLLYYIHAADCSGRSENHPYIGAPDPHVVTTDPDTEPPTIAHTPFEDIHLEDLPLAIATEVTDNGHVRAVTMNCWVEEDSIDFVLEQQEENTWTGLFDPDLEPGDMVYYCITAEDMGGNTTTLPESGIFSFHVLSTSVEDNTTPAQDTLLGCYPNPMRAGAGAVRYALAAPQDVRIEVYNVRGQRVRTLAEGQQSAGLHRVLWDGTSAQGAPVASGLYFIRLTSAGTSQVHKVLVLR